MLPAPPGWTGYGRYWAIFHAFQTIEEDHDAVYTVWDTADGLRLGAEVPESDVGGCRIASQRYSASLHPETNTIEIADQLTLDIGERPRAPVFRLNDGYRFAPGDVLEETGSRFYQPVPGQLVRAGGLLISWTRHPSRVYDLNYSGVLPPSDEDEIAPDAAYVTAWWLPSMGRLPFRVQATVDGPADWIVRSEGIPGEVKLQGQRKRSSFRCDVPISYPKVIGGRYTRMIDARSSNGDSFAIFQLPPTDPVRASRDLKNMMEAAAFYERVLGPLPFRGYECYDAAKYYGIESYSHTVLRRDVTHFISHEMGHTYFGGLAPCPYVRDSWNEGVTEYIDSVVLLHDTDRSLENGLGTLDIHVPLTQMPVPWNLGSATYWRGCYVMKMLESEIGPDRVLAALRQIATTRQGADTCWADIRPYFEKAGHKPLGWFWKQWIEGATFPTLSMETLRTEPRSAGYRTYVRVTQSGTASPYRLRFALATGSLQKPLSMSAGSATFTLNTPDRPAELHLQVFPFTLAKISGSVSHPRTR